MQKFKNNDKQELGNSIRIYEVFEFSPLITHNNPSSPLITLVIKEFL